MTASIRFALAFVVTGATAQAATIDDATVEDLLFTYSGASAGDYAVHSEIEGRL